MSRRRGRFGRITGRASFSEVPEETTRRKTLDLATFSDSDSDDEDAPPATSSRRSELRDSGDAFSIAHQIKGAVSRLIGATEGSGSSLSGTPRSETSRFSISCDGIPGKPRPAFVGVLEPHELETSGSFLAEESWTPPSPVQRRLVQAEERARKQEQEQVFPSSGPEVVPKVPVPVPRLAPSIPLPATPTPTPTPVAPAAAAPHPRKKKRPNAPLPSPPAQESEAQKRVRELEAELARAKASREQLKTAVRQKELERELEQVRKSEEELARKLERLSLSGGGEEEGEEEGEGEGEGEGVSEEVEETVGPIEVEDPCNELGSASESAAHTSSDDQAQAPPKTETEAEGVSLQLIVDEGDEELGGMFAFDETIEDDLDDLSQM